MNRRLALLALTALLGTVFAATNVARADCLALTDPPTPATATGVAVINGNNATIAFGGETENCWSTDLAGPGHSHEWHAAGAATSVTVTATDVTISFNASGSVSSGTINCGIPVGTASGIPGGLTGTCVGAVVGTTGVISFVAVG